MSLSPLRFLHASNLLIDSPLEGLAGLLPHSNDALQRAAQATRLAFERVVSAAIERQVDFVIFGGNTFVEAECSLGARVALLDAFERLARDEIRVFVVPGPADPAQAWRSIPDLPDNVTLFLDGESEPVAVFRDGKVVASVAAASRLAAVPPTDPTAPGALRSASERRTPFSVVLLVGDAAAGFDDLHAPPAADRAANAPMADGEPNQLPHFAADYVALCAGKSRRTIALKAGIAHHPGGTQGMRPPETGPRGCTVVDVEQDGTIQCTFLPTAAVTWGRHALEITAQLSEAELSEQMQAALRAHRLDDDDSPMLMEWSVRGAGPLMEALTHEEGRRRLLERHAERHAAEGAGRMLHAFRLVADDAGLRGTLEGDTLAIDSLDLIAQMERFPHEILARSLDEAALPEAEWQSRLQKLIPELDHEQVFSRARRLAASWFQSSAAGDART